MIVFFVYWKYRLGIGFVFKPILEIMKVLINNVFIHFKRPAGCPRKSHWKFSIDKKIMFL